MFRPANRTRIKSCGSHRAGQYEPNVAVRWQWFAGALLAALTPWAVAASWFSGFAFCLAGRHRAGLRLLAASMAALLLRWRSLQALRIHWSRRTADLHRTGRITRIASANVWNESQDVHATVAALMEEKADVLVVQEVTPRHLHELEDAGACDQYPYRAMSVDSSHTGLGVLSRFELSDPEWLVVAGEPQLKVWVAIPGGRKMRVYAVHAPSPLPAKVQYWRAWYELMACELSSELKQSEHPVVVAGDFNATVDHRLFRSLLRCGLCDTGTLMCSWQMTWSTRWSVLPALCRIDHVLTSSAVGIRDYRVAKRTGSDHRPVIVDLLT